MQERLARWLFGTPLHDELIRKLVRRVLVLALALGVIGTLLNGFIGYRVRTAETEAGIDRMADVIASFADSVGVHSIAIGDSDPQAELAAHLGTAVTAGPGFGESGEVLIARRRGDHIEFLVPARTLGGAVPEPESLTAPGDEPMALAVQGGNGVMRGRDFRGVRVLAAYRYLPSVDLGMVVKLDRAEVRAVDIGLTTREFATTLGAILVFSILLVRITAPVAGQLEAVAEAKDRFLSRMSHELRTPLNSVLGFAQLLKRGGLPPREAGHVEHILRGGERLLALINEILDLSRARSDRLKVEAEDFEVSRIVQDTIALIVPAADRRRIRLQTVGDLDAIVRADPNLVEQVLINLCSNAVKFNSEEGTVVVSVKRRDDGRVRVSVTDSGPGISEEDQARLFKPFERLANARGVEGTGLGLVLSRQFLEALGSRLHLESRLGAGATFWFDLDEPAAA